MQPEAEAEEYAQEAHDQHKLDKAHVDWDARDLDEYGSYATKHFAHSQMYYVRDVSKLWCEQACERNDMHLARHCAERYERACKVLQEWQCTGCAICSGSVTRATAVDHIFFE